MNEQEPVTIYQGRSTSPYFCIIQPVPGIELLKDQIINCVNPKSGKTIQGIVTEHYWIFDWNEAPRGFLFSIYGVEPALLRNVLIAKDEGFKDSWAILFLLKETN